MRFFDYDYYVACFPKRYTEVSQYVLKLTEELGEVAEIVNKDGVNFATKEMLIEELGDMLFQITAISALLNTSLSAIAEINMEKLDRRLNEQQLSVSSD